MASKKATKRQGNLYVVLHNYDTIPQLLELSHCLQNRPMTKLIVNHKRKEQRCQLLLLEHRIHQIVTLIASFQVRNSFALKRNLRHSRKIFPEHSHGPSMDLTEMPIVIKESEVTFRCSSGNVLSNVKLSLILSSGIALSITSSSLGRLLINCRDGMIRNITK